MAKNLSIVAQGISGDAGHLLGYNVTDNGIYTPAIGDVARDTTATYLAQDGTIKTAQENVARVDYTNGVAELLLEPESKNLLEYSNQISPTFRTPEVLVTENYAISPDGTLNANKIKFKYDGNSAAYQSNLSYENSHSFSFYYKGEGDDIGKTFGVRLVGTTETRFFLLTLTNKWKRFEGESDGLIGYEINNKDGSNIGLGSVILYGFQLEALPYATSYIPTNGAIATRGADSLTNFGSEQIIDSESGILFFEGSLLSVSGNNRSISLNDGSSSNTLYLIFFGNGDTKVSYYSSNSSGMSDVITNTNITDTKKYVIQYSQNIINVFIDGTSVYSGSINGFSANILKELDFNSSSTSESFYGRVRQVKHLPYNTDITTL